MLVGKDGTSDANDSLEYQVLDMYTNPNSEASPAYCGGLNYDTGFNDLTSVSEADGDNFVYMVANSTSNELKIIQGGPDQDYVSSGIYESPPFTASVSSSFNRFVANIDPLQLASLSAQVAVAPPGSSGCTDATYNYVGPNGDVNAFFTAKGASISATIPFGNYISAAYQNPERCFRYKMWFSASPDFTQTPVLKDMTWSYSQ